MHSYLGAWNSLLIFRELLEYQMFASYYFPESYWQCRWSDCDEAFWYVPLLMTCNKSSISKIEAHIFLTIAMNKFKLISTPKSINFNGQPFITNDIKCQAIYKHVHTAVTKTASEPRHDIFNNVVCATSKASDQPAHTHSLIRDFASRLIILWLLSYWLNSIWSF